MRLERKTVSVSMSVHRYLVNSKISVPRQRFVMHMGRLKQASRLRRAECKLISDTWSQIYTDTSIRCRFACGNSLQQAHIGPCSSHTLWNILAGYGRAFSFTHKYFKRIATLCWKRRVWTADGVMLRNPFPFITPRLSSWTSACVHPTQPDLCGAAVSALCLPHITSQGSKAREPRKIWSGQIKSMIWLIDYM